MKDYYYHTVLHSMDKAYTLFFSSANPAKDEQPTIRQVTFPLQPYTTAQWALDFKRHQTYINQIDQITNRSTIAYQFDYLIDIHLTCCAHWELSKQTQHTPAAM